METIDMNQPLWTLTKEQEDKITLLEKAVKEFSRLLGVGVIPSESYANSLGLTIKKCLNEQFNLDGIVMVLNRGKFCTYWVEEL